MWERELLTAYWNDSRLSAALENKVLSFSKFCFLTRKITTHWHSTTHWQTDTRDYWGPVDQSNQYFGLPIAFVSPLWLLHSAFVSLPSLCPLEHWLKMNCWLQVAPSMLRAESHVVTDNSQRVGDGLNCHMVIHTFSLCFHILHPRLKLLLFFHSTSFFLFPPSALLFQTSQKKQRSDGGFFSSLDLTTHGTVEQRERERV